MSEIFVYAIGVMYTPGPVNLLGLHSGINRKTRSHLGFFIGVASAMFILFVFLGFIGLKVINPQILPFVSLAGCSYILYIAWKVAHTKVTMSSNHIESSTLRFRDGLLMQLLNPKALVATLPISTIQFPSLGITGTSIIVWSFVLAVLAFGAPTSYSVAGLYLGKRMNNPRYFKIFNLMMAGLLVYVSATIALDHVIEPIIHS